MTTQTDINIEAVNSHFSRVSCEMVHSAADLLIVDLEAVRAVLFPDRPDMDLSVLLSSAVSFYRTQIEKVMQ